MGGCQHFIRDKSIDGRNGTLLTNSSMLGFSIAVWNSFRVGLLPSSFLIDALWAGPPTPAFAARCQFSRLLRLERHITYRIPDLRILPSAEYARRLC